jgi:hypothetical protein
MPRVRLEKCAGHLTWEEKSGMAVLFFDFAVIIETINGDCILADAAEVRVYQCRQSADQHLLTLTLSKNY